jgi:Bacterial alpha-L-rhamnosidase C-terminal domain/Bacterial alpha-L-rhamnosidase 6 hairpin glycosidase domain
VDIKPYLFAGNNVVAIQGQNVGGGADAGSVIAALELYSSGTLTNRYVTDTSWKALASTPATGPAGWTTQSFDDSSWGNAVISGAYGVSPWNTSVTTPSSTVTNTIAFTAPLTKAHATGTILGTITPAGATNLKVASVTGFSAGQQVAIDTDGGRELATISSVGTAGAGGTGITLTAPTTNAHNGAVLVDAVVAPAGATNVKVASVTGFAVGDTMLVDTGAAQQSVTITAVGTAGATGTGVTFTPALTQLHPGGTTVVDLGTGITVSTPFTLAHAAGVAIRGLGSGITFAPPLTQSHAAGTTVTTTATTVAGDANGNNGVGTDGSRADNFTLTTASGGTTVGNAVNLVQGGERFQAITLTTPGTVVLSSVGITIKHFNQGAASYQGYFLSNDTTLNRIWYDGVYTNQTDSILPGGVCSNATTCSQTSTILDGAKRDRRPWSGDLTVEGRSIFDSLGFGPGASEIIKNTIGQFGSSPQANGSICGQISNWIAYPTSGVSCSFYSPTYSMYWSRGLQQYYLYSGDQAFAEAEYQTMKNELAFDRTSWNPTTGLTTAAGSDWDFYDGTKCGSGCATTATNMLYYDDLAGAARMARDLAQNDPTNSNAPTWTTDAATWSSQADALKTAINSQLFNTAKGVYQLSSSDNGSHAAMSVPQDANGQAIEFGVAPSDQDAGILSYLKNNLWGTFGPQPYSTDANYATTISPFVSGFELDARFIGGDTTSALALTRLLWAQMVDPTGPFFTGTLWERLGQNGNIESSNASQAHGWASAPVSAFTRFLLGVQPVDPGYATWTIAPQTGDLSWAQGNVPTPAGPIVSRWQMDNTNHTFALTVSAPAATSGTVSLPELSKWATIAENGKVVWAGGAAVGGSSATEVNGRVVFSNFTGSATFGEVLDSNAPTTTASVTPAAPDGHNGWYVTSPKVTLSATDDAGGSGVASTSYTIDGGATQTYSAPFTVDDGTHTVQFWSTDNAGNVETAHTITLKVDTTEPVVGYTGNAGTYTPFQTVSIQCTATDPSPGSGIDPSATSCADVNGPAYSFGLGPHTFNATATDLAGNTASASTTFTVTTSGCLASTTGPLTVRPGQSVCVAPGATVTGPLTVNAGGSLYAEGATITGPVKASGAALVRICGSQVAGPLSIDSSTGIVVLGGDAATGPCSGNTITGPVSITGNTAGVEFNNNHVTGPLTITGNTGTLPPPDTGSVHVIGNTVTGPTKVQQ